MNALASTADACASRGYTDHFAPTEGAGATWRARFGLLSPADLAELIGIDERTLAVWRVQKRGPDFVKLGRAVFYRQGDISNWIELNATPTDRVA